jgi:mannitol-specific phosphotransferase system IIBC component
VKNISIQKIGAWLSPMISTLIATGLTYGLVSKIFIYLEVNYEALINPSALMSACVYTAIFTILLYITAPLIDTLFGNKYAESKGSNNSPDKDTARLTHEDYTIAAIINRLTKERR